MKESSQKHPIKLPGFNKEPIDDVLRNIGSFKIMKFHQGV